MDPTVCPTTTTTLETCMHWCDMHWCDMHRCDMHWSLVLHGLVRHALAQHALVQHAMVRHAMVRHALVSCTTWTCATCTGATCTGATCTGLWYYTWTATWHGCVDIVVWTKCWKWCITGWCLLIGYILFIRKATRILLLCAQLQARRRERGIQKSARSMSCVVRAA